MHIPRVIASVGRGMLRGRSAPQRAREVGLRFDDPHVYRARAGLFDVDYLGHMNNAAYLAHAEFARWEMCAANGMMAHMFQEREAFLVASVVVRYRREMKPLFRKFQVDSNICSLDERNIWMLQNFRYPGQGGVHKIRAQVLLKAVLINSQKEVIDPRPFLIEKCHVDSEVIAQLDHSGTTTSPPPSSGQKEGSAAGSSVEEQLLFRFEELEKSLQMSAAADDERIDG